MDLGPSYCTYISALYHHKNWSLFSTVQIGHRFPRSAKTQLWITTNCQVGGTMVPVKFNVIKLWQFISKQAHEQSNWLNHFCIWLRIRREIRKYMWPRTIMHSTEFFAQRGVKLLMFLLLQQPLKQQYFKKKVHKWSYLPHGSIIKVKIGDFRCRISPRLLIYIRNRFSPWISGPRGIVIRKKLEVENLVRLSRSMCKRLL
jgi:hypothetical protein